jgi:uncharacterized protein
MAEPRMIMEVDCLRRAGFGDVLDSPFLRRLAGVSFLSTLDLVYQISLPPSRFEHSVGVGYVALLMSANLGLTQEQTECLVIANLLHDIGHAPFSHNSEPFLLEHLNLYHKGLGSTYLRYNKSLFPGESSMGALLENRSSGVRSCVASLLSESRGTDWSNLDELFRCPINCDKIDGNNRTLRLLGLKNFSEQSLLDAFISIGGSAYVRWQAVPILTQFWEAERDLYWEHIYTREVFAAEAMITKALEQVFDSPERVASFVVSTDKQALDLMKTNELGQELIGRLERREFLRCLSETDPSLFATYKPKFSADRFDKDARRKLEHEIAAQIGMNPELVISHFSRRKHFDKKPEVLIQRMLFDDPAEAVSLESVRRAFVASKISGDYFEVFHP